MRSEISPEKAWATAPALLILEDLDSLVSDKVRGCFLNEVDGLLTALQLLSKILPSRLKPLREQRAEKVPEEEEVERSSNKYDY